MSTEHGAIHFVKFVSTHKAMLETIFGGPIRGDFATKAIRTLNNFLDHAGVSVMKVRTEVIKERPEHHIGVKSYIYGLDVAAIDRLEAIILRRSERAVDVNDVVNV